MVSKRMKTTPAMACLKTLLTIFSFIFVIIGIGILGFGIFARIKLLNYLALSTINFANAPWAMIAIGAFIVIVGILGCCATIKGNTCLLRTYGFLLALVFICELGGAVVAIVFKGKVDVGFKDGMTKAIKNYSKSASDKQHMDEAQKTLKCCGVTNYTDYWTVGSFKTNTVPESCCSNATWCANHETGGIVKLDGVTSVTEYIYSDGCHAKVFGMVNSNLAIIIGSMFGVAFFQVIGIILACCLASTINTNKYELV